MDFIRYVIKETEPSIIFNCQQLVPGTGSSDMPRLGLTWLGFAVVKPAFSGPCKYWVNWLFSGQKKPTWIIAAWQISPFVPAVTVAREKSNSSLWVNMAKLQLGINEGKKKKTNAKRRKQIVKFVPKRTLCEPKTEEDDVRWGLLESAERDPGQALAEATSESPSHPAAPARPRCCLFWACECYSSALKLPLFH